MAKDIPINNSKIVEEKLSKELLELQEKKIETDLVNGRTKTYIADKIYKFRKDWWETWYRMLKSEDSSEKKTAIIEYNKLQQRVLPTQLEGSGKQAIQINILSGVGVDDPCPVEGEIIE